MKKQYWVCFCCLLLLKPLEGHSQKFSCAQITIDLGRSQNSVNCAIQDHRGFPWIGTDDGLDEKWIFTDSKKRSATYNTIPAWWQTWWFRSMVFLLIAVVVFLWHKRRLKKLADYLKDKSSINRFFEKYNISKREGEVLKLLIRGKNSREIENELFISPHTVKNHIYNIYKKIGVNNRSQMINLFWENQLANGKK